MSLPFAEMAFDPELRAGAHNAFYVCLRETAGKGKSHKDIESSEIAASLVSN